MILKNHIICMLNNIYPYLTNEKLLISELKGIGVKEVNKQDVCNPSFIYIIGVEEMLLSHFIQRILHLHSSLFK